MKQIDKELERIVGKNPGFTVPDGYFDNAFKNISENLPEYQTASKPNLTGWQRIRPYVYLAAMFAGIWCMMKMFHMASLHSEGSLDNPPALVAEAISNGSLLEEMTPADYEDFSYFDVEESLIDNYDNIDEIKKDFTNETI